MIYIYDHICRWYQIHSMYPQVRLPHGAAHSERLVQRPHGAQELGPLLAADALRALQEGGHEAQGDVLKAARHLHSDGYLVHI